MGKKVAYVWWAEEEASRLPPKHSPLSRSNCRCHRQGDGAVPCGGTVTWELESLLWIEENAGWKKVHLAGLQLVRFAVGEAVWALLPSEMRPVCVFWEQQRRWVRRRRAMGSVCV